jgi:hypothetical protein
MSEIWWNSNDLKEMGEERETFQELAAIVKWLTEIEIIFVNTDLRND